MLDNIERRFRAMLSEEIPKAEVSIGESDFIFTGDKLFAISVPRLTSKFKVTEEAIVLSQGEAVFAAAEMAIRSMRADASEAYGLEPEVKRREEAAAVEAVGKTIEHLKAFLDAFRDHETGDLEPIAAAFLDKLGRMT